MFDVIASPEEHRLITTNPDEMIKKSEEKKGNVVGKENISISLDIMQDVHPAEGKSIEEKNFLSNNGYVFGKFHGLTKDWPLDYFVKERHPESVLHTYCVDIIYQKIKKYTEKIEKYRTERADIVFTNKEGEEIAIEVETGIDAKYENKKKYHNEKFSVCRKKYGNRCYIFLPTKNLKNSYARHKLPILFRLDV